MRAVLDTDVGPTLRDPSDDMVLETAVNGQADLLVTFNHRDFAPAASHFGLAVKGPAESLALIGDRT